MTGTSQTGDTVASLIDDSKRFQAWQRDALEARPPSTRLVSIGPFQLLVPEAHRNGWMTLIEGSPTEGEVRDAVAWFGSAFELEYNDAVFPQVGAWLEAAGLTLDRSDPLMACRPVRFQPFNAPGVSQNRLTRSSAAKDLEAFQAIRWTNGGDVERAVPPISQLRKELAMETSVYLLARVDGERAGTGVSHALNGAAEIVGVVTRADKRRRGIAATVTSQLVADHFAGGGDFAFLDAANEPAVRVYERLGFRQFGINRVYSGG